MCADADEQAELKEIKKRREAENANKKVIEPPKNPPLVMHDWTHHFRTVRQWGKKEEVCASLQTPVNGKHLKRTSGQSTHQAAQRKMVYELLGSTYLQKRA